MPTDFMADFTARVVALVVPAAAPTAARVDIDVSTDAVTEYAGSQDEVVEVTYSVSATGYGTDGKVLWSHSKEYDEFGGTYGGPRGLMRILADLAEVEGVPTGGCDHCKGTVTEHESHCMRGR